MLLVTNTNGLIVKLFMVLLTSGYVLRPITGRLFINMPLVTNTNGQKTLVVILLTTLELYTLTISHYQ